MGATGLLTGLIIMMGIEFYFDSKINKVKHLIFGHNTNQPMQLDIVPNTNFDQITTDDITNIVNAIPNNITQLSFRQITADDVVNNST